MLKPKYQKLYGKLAVELGSISQCNRLKVGAFVIQIVDGIPSIIADGVNGLPSGESNCCEDNNGKTVDGVRHAEVAALSKLPATVTVGKTLVVSDSPCPDCADAIINAGIHYVYYVREYRKPEGIDTLRAAGIHVERIVDLRSAATRGVGLGDVGHNTGDVVPTFPENRIVQEPRLLDALHALKPKRKPAMNKYIQQTLKAIEKIKARK
jgi:dCMP deaminase